MNDLDRLALRQKIAGAHLDSIFESIGRDTARIQTLARCASAFRLEDDTAGARRSLESAVNQARRVTDYLHAALEKLDALDGFEPPPAGFPSKSEPLVLQRQAD